jgi:putative addiction module component (TIGR02574 family)
MLFTFSEDEKLRNLLMIKTEADRILSNALRQTDTERARIAEALIASLDASMDEDVDRAWQIEIEKRIRDLDSGVARSIPWEDFRDRLYRNANVQR